MKEQIDAETKGGTIVLPVDKLKKGDFITQLFQLEGERWETVDYKVHSIFQHKAVLKSLTSNHKVDVTFTKGHLVGYTFHHSKLRGLVTEYSLTYHKIRDMLREVSDLVLYLDVYTLEELLKDADNCRKWEEGQV